MKYNDILLAAKNSGKSLKEYCQENDIDYKALITETLETDDRSEVSITRNEDGKIVSYNYKLFKRDKPSLIGSLSREEMNMIYRLYSYYGDALTQRTIARHFTELSLIDFKRVLRAFNITKSSGPFAPHMYEEHTEDELKDIQLREKENSFLRKAEEAVIKNNEKLLKKYAQENITLKEQLKEAQFTVNLETVNPYIIESNSIKSDKTINLYLADMHIGAAVVSGVLYADNINYGAEEITRRLKCIIDNLSDIGPFSKINLVLMGDNIDCCGIYGRTARLDHEMPENMDPREQANNFLTISRWFIASLINTFKCEVEVFSVPCGNHAGNYEYVCNKALMSAINAEFPTIKTTLWEEFYGTFEVNGYTYIICHGKNF